MKYVAIIFAALISLTVAVPTQAQETPPPPSKTCEAPFYSFDENMAAIDAMVKSGGLKQAIVFKFPNPGNPKEYMLFMLKDASGDGMMFYFLNDCMTFIPGTQEAMKPFKVNEKFMEFIAKAEVVYEGGNVKEFLNLKAPKPEPTALQSLGPKLDIRHVE